MTTDVDQPLRDFTARAMTLLEGGASQAGDRAALTFHRLAGDGSNRKIYRVRQNELQAIAVSNPLPRDRSHPDENEGFLAVREFLQRRRVRVPAFYAGDLDRGFLLLEDLGDLRLHDLIRTSGWESRTAAGQMIDLYKEAIRSLVRMQEPATPPFNPNTVSNAAYTETFVIDQEAGYFQRELVRALAQRTDSFNRLEPECRRLARTAIPDPGGTHGNLVFMHRDFQSRNLMVTGATLAVIDFQGARLGPAEYDLAALLYDPYVAMPEEIRAALLEFYLTEASHARVPGVPESPRSTAYATWQRRFLANAANRLMQALGAFAKLGGREKRPGFLEHIPQGLRNLETVLTTLEDSPKLLGLVADLRARGFTGP
jgi:aminoglycoside/choline kinase family phosphotransferase